MTDILKDLVVIELASVLAGPLVGSFLAEHGAKVIKIENKKFGGEASHSQIPSLCPTHQHREFR